MATFLDVTCRCGKRIGWIGSMIDCPECPKCGYRPSKESLQQKQDALHGAEKDIVKEIQERNKQLYEETGIHFGELHVHNTLGGYFIPRNLDQLGAVKFFKCEWDEELQDYVPIPGAGICSQETWKENYQLYRSDEEQE